jgi:hypothetical protein
MPTLVPSETTRITPDILKSVNLAIRAELSYQRLTNCGRKFGITGEIGEILACHRLGLFLVKHPRSIGYDAVDQKSQRIQIKTRRSETSEVPNVSGRLGTFSKHPFDYALMVILSSDYKVREIWRARASHLEPIIGRHKKRNPTLRQFKSVGQTVYTMSVPAT